MRAGLTIKPVDVDELLRIVDTTPLAEPVRAGRRPTTGSTTTCNWCDSKPATSTARSATRCRIDLSGEAWYLAPGDERLVTVDHLRRHQLTGLGRRHRTPCC